MPKKVLGQRERLLSLFPLSPFSAVFSLMQRGKFFLPPSLPPPHLSSGETREEEEEEDVIPWKVRRGRNFPGAVSPLWQYGKGGTTFHEN